MTAPGPLDLEHRDPRGPQVAGEPGTVATGSLYTGTPYGAETLRPPDEALVTLHVRRHGQLSQAPAQLVSRATATCKSRCVSTPKTTPATVAEPSWPLIITSIAPLS